MSEEALNRAVIEMREVQVAALRDPSLIVLENVNWSVLPRDFWWWPARNTPARATCSCTPRV
jgi:hypothetical protein